jgi:hypothetical protein
MPVRRTTHRRSKGAKLYAVRDSKGRFEDVQTYKRAHGMDIKRSSKAEAVANEKKNVQRPFQRVPPAPHPVLTPCAQS